MLDAGFESSGCAVPLTAQANGKGMTATAVALFGVLGPAIKQKVAVFQCGAPWTKYASDTELVRLGRLQGRIDRKTTSLAELRAERTKIMMRCIRRMRRERGVE